MKYYVVSRMPAEGLWQKHGPLEGHWEAIRAAARMKKCLHSGYFIMVASERQVKKRFGDARIMLQA